MYRVEPISRTHDRSKFECGVEELDVFLHRYARQNDAPGLGRTYVLVEAGDTEVLGYYTLSAGSVSFDTVPESVRLPRYPVPTAHLGRLATATKARGRGLGELLLLHALETIVGVADQMGVFLIDVVAVSEEARAYYLARGFSELRDDAMHLFMAVETARGHFPDGP